MHTLIKWAANSLTY